MDETVKEAWENRWLPQIEQRSGEQLWSQPRAQMDSLVRFDQDTAKVVAAAALAPDIKHPASYLNKILQRRKLVPWLVAGTVATERTVEVWAPARWGQADVRQAARMYHHEIGLKFSPKDLGTRRADQEQSPELEAAG